MVSAPLDDSLRSELKSLLECARELVATAVVASGRELVSRTEQLLVEDNAEGNGWQGRWAEVDVNALAAFPQFEYKRTLEDWAPRAYELAVRLEERFRDSLPPPSPIGSMGAELVSNEWRDTSGKDPARRVMGEFVLAPTRWYLAHVKNVTVAEPELVDHLAAQVVEILGTAQFVVRQSVAFEHMKLPADLNAGSVRVRALSPAERGAYLEPFLPRRATQRRNASIQHRYIVPTVELDVDTTIEEARLYGTLPPPTILVAMQLHQIPLIGPGVLSSRITPEWYSLGTMNRSVPMRQDVIEASPYELTQKQLEAATETAGRLAAYRIHDPQRPAELALRRFSLGCGRDDFADALVDFVVALEALLLPYDEQTRNADLSYRFRMHGAHFISDLPGERRVIFRQLRDLYKIRSTLVHGGAYPSTSAVRSAEREAFTLAARGLLKAVNEGFPDAVQFQRLLLGDW